MANLAQKYRPKTFDEITEQRVVVDIVSNICNSADVLSNRNFLFIGPAGTGKAQPLDSSVLTPHGVKLMGDIKIDDQVVTGHGNIGNVTGIYPQGRRNIYRITLSDDSSIRVSDEHLNVFYTEDETTSERIDYCETTMQLISRFELNSEPLNVDCLHLIHDEDARKYSVEIDRWNRRYITSITYEGIEECQCIMIDHPDHTYVSDGLIPTHNTTTARAIGTALNGNSENIIEVDAASHSGVDSMREIIEQAKSYPVGSKYKVFIIDECFHRDSLVATPFGDKKIADLHSGDEVFGLGGVHRVQKLFENTVESSNLVLLHTSQQDILTTKDHLFMTEFGWIRACDLQKGDSLYAESTAELRDMREGVRELRQRSSQDVQQGVWRDSEEATPSGISSELSANWLRKAMSRLWEDVLHSPKCKFRDVFKQVCNTVAEAARPLGETAGLLAEYQTLIYLSSVWKAEVSAEVRSEEVLLNGLHGSVPASASGDPSCTSYTCLCDMWNFIQSQKCIDTDLLSEVQEYTDRQKSGRQIEYTGFSANEVKESDVRSSIGSENDEDQRTEWYLACASGYAWWKWFLYSSSDASLSEFDFGVYSRISCENACISGQSDALSYKLQSRPRTSGYMLGSRSGWCRPQYEVAQIARSEKRGVFDRSRVESIEIYKQGDNEQSFRSYFSDTELHSGYVTMYDLEVEGHPSYFVNGVLVHNCHAFSVAAWQAALKTLEEQPARSIFLLCVTGDGLVPTDSGLKRMDMISVGDQVWDGEQFRHVDNVFDNGEQHCLKLILKDGSSLTCTDDHQIEVLQGDVLVWKKAKDITSHDHLLVYNNQTNGSLESDLSAEEAWMLGYITGNGNYTPHSLDLYTPFHKWDKVKSYLDSLVSKKIIKDYIVDGDKRALDNHIHDTRIHFFSDKYHPGMSQWYSKTGLDPNYTRGTKKIPNCIYSATPELIREFVEGWYYADGDGQHSSFFDPNPDTRISRPYIYCSNHDMLSSLQQILRTIGLYSSIHTQSTVITEEDYQNNDFIKPGVYQSYLLYLLNKPGYFDDDQFRSILLSKYNSMPSGKYHLDLAHLKNPNRRISPKMITEAGYDYSDKGRFMNVVSIEDAGIQHVYDIEVRDSHKFVYNGVVVHNCTTNPEKIPATILSRVQTFQLTKISLNGIYNRLIYIINHENAEGKNIAYEEEAVRYIAKLAQGGMRDAITNLEQVLAYTSNITSQAVQEALSLPAYDDYFKLLNAYAKKQNDVLVSIIDNVYNSGVNFIKWFDGFFSFVTNIVKYIYTKDINSTMIPSTYQDKIQGYSTAHAALCLKLSRMLVKMIQELKGTQYLQEVAISYLCTPQTAQKGQ